MKAYEVVLDWVESRILSGELSIGAVLPAERELAARLDVSRSAVREAVRTLSAQGVLRSSVGAGSAGGTTVTALPKGSLTRFLRLHVALASFPVDDVIESRIALERLSARLAAQHASAEHLSVMRAAVAVMDDPSTCRMDFNDADTDFHVAIAAAAGNRLATELTVAIRESLRLPILDAFRRVGDWGQIAADLRREHHEILAAVESGDVSAAESAVEGHIRSAWRALTARPSTGDSGDP